MKLVPSILVALALSTSSAQAAPLTVGAQDPGANTPAHMAASFDIARGIGARNWRVLVDARTSPVDAIEQVRKVRAAGFSPLVTIGGKFNGGMPSRELIAALAPTARWFTVYNEPDCGCDGPELDPAEYRALYVASRQLIRSINPAAKVLVGDVTNHGANYLKRMEPVKNDGIAWHPYPPRWASPNSRSTILMLKKMNGLRITWRAPRIWATEYAVQPSAPGVWWRVMARRLERMGHTRAYVYHLTGAGPSWDTALTDSRGRPRPGFYSVRRLARR